MNADLVMEQILSDTEATEYQVFLSDSLENNFRYKIDPLYKANRKDAAKPKWYKSLQMFLKDKWGAVVTDGQEADDALGIEQTANNEWEHSLDGPERAGESIICSIDKDLLQVPGLHYNLKDRVHTSVNYLEGFYNFYSQFLIGDRVDNIRGVDGIGPVKTARILGPSNQGSEREWFDRVRLLYQDDERLLKNGRLLWVRRYRDQIWSFPEGSASSLHGGILQETDESESGEQDAETE